MVLVASSLATWLITLPLPADLRVHPFPFFYAYVLFIAWYLDAWEVLAAVAFGTIVLADVLPPDRSLAIANPVDMISEAVFTSTALLMGMLIVRLRHTHAALRAAASDSEAARLMAEAAVQAQDRFLSSVSHELQTPLTALRAGLGMLQLSARARLEPAEDALLENAVRNAERLRRHIADLLTLNQLRAQVVELDRKHIDLREVVMDALAGLQPLLAEKHQALHMDLPEPLEMLGDARRLEQVIVNVVSNAYRHTPAGTHIDVVGRLDGHDILLEIRDDGPGIPPGEVARIFDRFYRLEATREGMGMGLAITRGIVKLHGGRLGVESTPGAGATFSMRFVQAAEDSG